MYRRFGKCFFLQVFEQCGKIFVALDNAFAAAGEGITPFLVHFVEMNLSVQVTFDDPLRWYAPEYVFLAQPAIYKRSKVARSSVPVIFKLRGFSTVAIKPRILSAVVSAIGLFFSCGSAFTNSSSYLLTITRLCGVEKVGKIV